MALENASLAGPEETAPWYRAPAKSIVSVEHPFIVKNIDKGIAMLGGPAAIAQIVEKDSDKPMNLSFHPEDVASRPIISFNANTNNVLLKVTVPKRTGRKRKRGSDEPFVVTADVQETRKDAQYLLRSLRDNAEGYDLEPHGIITSTHVWRAIPDLVYATSQSAFLNEFRSKIIPQQYPLLKEWELPRNYGLENTEVIPPPIFSTHSVPHNYVYRQNPAVKQVIDPKTGAKIFYNTQAPSRVHTNQMQWDSPEYPLVPSPTCPPLDKEPHNFRGLVYILQQIFEIRPIWTRRAIINQLPSNAPVFLARNAIAYVAYALRSGPWRDAYCKLGLDPRSDPKYRIYQTLLLQLVTSKPEKRDQRDEYLRSWARSKDQKSHIFTGEGKVPPDGKSWQLCDLEDPVLKSLVDLPELYIRPECERRYFGWYLNGTWTKLKIVMKTKVDDMMDGVEVDDGRFSRFLKLPEEYHGGEEDAVAGFLPKEAGKQELAWAAAYRAMCRTPVGNVPMSGRLSKSKPETRKSFRPDGTEMQTGGETEENEDGDVEGDDVLATFADPEDDPDEDEDADFDLDPAGEGLVEAAELDMNDGASVV